MTQPSYVINPRLPIESRLNQSEKRDVKTAALNTENVFIGQDRGSKRISRDSLKMLLFLFLMTLA